MKIVYKKTGKKLKKYKEKRVMHKKVSRQYCLREEER